MDGKKSSTIKPMVSRAPTPINPVGASSMPHRAKATQMPIDWPANYPNDLIPQTEKVVAEAVKKFPEQTQITELCESVVSTLTPDFCAAVQGKTLRADLASYRMDNLLDCLLGYNCDDPSERYRLKKKVVNSDEWKKFVVEIARVASAGRPQSQPTGHKDAKHAKVTAQLAAAPAPAEAPKDTPKCNTWQKKLDDPKKYPWMTILETQEALGGISNSRVYALKDEGELQVLADIKPIRITTESVILLMEGKSDKIA